MKTTVFSKIKLGIGAKVTLALLATGLLTTIATSYIATTRGTEQLRQKSYQQLKSVRTTLQGHIQEYLGNARKDLEAMSDSLTVREALPELTAARKSLLADLETAGANLTADTQGKIKTELATYYSKVLAANLQKVRNVEAVPVEGLMPIKPEAQLLQYVYTVLNPSAVGSKSDLTAPADITSYATSISGLASAFAKTDYATKHDRYHNILTPHRLRNGYYDIFLVDTNGDVVYTNFKELDFQGNLVSGSEKDSGLGQAYAGAIKCKKGEVFFTNVAPYAKSYDAPAIFAGSPVTDDAGQTIGAMIYQLPLDKISGIMTFAGQHQDAGLGDSGEAYLVALDGDSQFKLLSESRFVKDLAATNKKTLVASDGVTRTESAIGTLKIESQATKDSRAGNTAEAEYSDYRGVPVLGSYAKLNLPGTNWGIVSEIDAEEAFAPAAQLGRTILLWGAGILALSGVVAWLFGRFLTRPIALLKQTITDLGSGNDAARAPVVSNDEVGEVAYAFNAMIEDRNTARDRIVDENRALQRNIQDILITVSDASDGKLDVRAKVTEGALGNLADALNLMLENVGDLVKDAKGASGEVAVSAGEIEVAARQLSESAGAQVTEVQKTNEGVHHLSSQASVVLENCQQAAKAAGDTNESAAQGFRAVQEVVDGMQRIREIVQANAKKIKRLGDRSLEISQIVKFISEISAKTDILALNAAIEASRAGEQGRGFTVVAEEVRGLADRTRSLTAQIEGLVSAIQTETAEAVVQMEEQTHEVERGAQTALGAGQALETIVASSEQSAQIVESINKAAQDQADSTERMKGSVANINRLVTDTQSQVTQASSISRALAKLSKTLTGQLDAFEVASA